MIAARDLVSRGLIGDLHDVDVRVTCFTPWHLWKFLYGIPRMEIVYHSIHYVDLVRSFLGEPAGVWCKTLKAPGDDGARLHPDGHRPRLRRRPQGEHRHEPRAPLRNPPPGEPALKLEGTRGASS
jgi:predicted dehydrogenase